MRLVAQHIFLFVALLLMLGCTADRPSEGHCPLAGPPAPQEFRPDGARLTNIEAIRLAKQEAVKQGVDLCHFHEPLMDYFPNGTNWFLVFWGKEHRYPGDYFSVYMNDQTGETRFDGGR